MLLREREKKKAANPRNMLVLLSDPALPRKAPRGGGRVGEGCLPPSSAAAPRRDPRAQSEPGRGLLGSEGPRANRGGAPCPRGAGPEYLRRERDAASRPASSLRGRGAAAAPSESVGAAAVGAPGSSPAAAEGGGGAGGGRA